jgi:hypothetical protein
VKESSHTPSIPPREKDERRKLIQEYNKNDERK